jgi:hypothetical protein
MRSAASASFPSLSDNVAARNRHLYLAEFDGYMAVVDWMKALPFKPLPLTQICGWNVL